MIETTRTCKVCDQDKPITSFAKTGDGKYHAWTCGQCRRRYYAAKAKLRLEDGSKTCSVCRVEKLLIQFPRRGGYRLPRCYVCLQRAKRQRRAAQHGSERQYWKKRAVARLGGRCQCCGESELSFLQFDHKNGDGMSHRASVHQQTAQWVALAEDPASKIRLLCANCHWGVTLNDGVCPHQKGQA